MAKLRDHTTLIVGLSLAIWASAASAETKPLGQSVQPLWLASAARLPLNPTVCFANWENSATYKVQAQSVKNAINAWQSTSGLSIQWKEQCDKPKSALREGRTVDIYPEDVRILLTNNSPRSTPWSDTSQAINGNACDQSDNVNTELKNDPSTNAPSADGLHHCEGYMWANYPSSSEDADHYCEYNMHLAYNQNENNYQHEFGHSLGFLHEHTRPDANPNCREKITPQVGNIKILSAYDPESVMNYVFTIWDDENKIWKVNPKCPEVIGDNWGTIHQGLSRGDHLSARVVYPPNRFASIFGSTVTWAGVPILLYTSWEEMGVNVTDDYLESMASNFEWRLDGIPVGSTRQYSASSLPAGKHKLELKFQDPFNQGDRSSYFSQYEIIVFLSENDYLKYIAPVFATPLLLMGN